MKPQYLGFTAVLAVKKVGSQVVVWTFGLQKIRHHWGHVLRPVLDKPHFYKLETKHGTCGHLLTILSPSSSGVTISLFPMDIALNSSKGIAPAKQCLEMHCPFRTP